MDFSVFFSHFFYIAVFFALGFASGIALYQRVVKLKEKFLEKRD